MVATWSRQWIRSRGTRVIYTVPRPLIERVLPLRDRVALDTVVARAGVDFLHSLDRFLEPHTRRALARTDVEVVRRSARQVSVNLDP